MSEAPTSGAAKRKFWPFHLLTTVLMTLITAQIFSSARRNLHPFCLLKPII